MAEAFIYDNIEQQNKYQAEGIEILVQMAKAGKIDPWNIDIIDVTDKYLSHLFEIKAQNGDLGKLEVALNDEKQERKLEEEGPSLASDEETMDDFSEFL